MEKSRRDEGAAAALGSAREIANRRKEGGISRISVAVWVPFATLILVKKRGLRVEGTAMIAGYL